LSWAHGRRPPGGAQSVPVHRRRCRGVDLVLAQTESVADVFSDRRGVSIGSLTHTEPQTATPDAASKFSPVAVGKCRHRTHCQPSDPPGETPESSCRSTCVHLSCRTSSLVRGINAAKIATCPQIRAQVTHSLSACPPQAPGVCPHPLWITCFPTHSSARTVTRVERGPATFGGLSEPGRNVPRTVIDDQMCQHLVGL